ncbi:TBC1 domain family member 13 [Pelomyxa schiedti]|nr:TBC1 domain family member 13 [Pelomyxa schiedti]
MLLWNLHQRTLLLLFARLLAVHLNRIEQQPRTLPDSSPLSSEGCSSTSESKNSSPGCSMATPAMPSHMKNCTKSSQRIALFEEAISPTLETLSLTRIRELAFQGIPDMSNLRPLYWKILLDFLPLDRSQWATTLFEKRKSYCSWRVEFDLEMKTLTELPSVSPLAPDKLAIDEIIKDITRTSPHLQLFNFTSGETVHYHALKHILFIFAKLNPGIRYVQGMNAILAPLYYVCTSEAGKDDPEALLNAEADTFFCFSGLMAEVMDHFIKSMDSSSVGVHKTLGKLDALLEFHDYELWTTLESKGLTIELYTLRWILLLVSQEFELPDVLRLWDSFLADANRFDFMLYFCCAMIINVRDELLIGDFPSNMFLLQNYPPMELNTLLQQAAELRDNTDPLLLKNAIPLNQKREEDFSPTRHDTGSDSEESSDSDTQTITRTLMKVAHITKGKKKASKKGPP